MQIQLIIKGEFFDQIASGAKTKEYRAMSDRNVSLFISGSETGNPEFKPIKTILFFLGYTKGRKSMVLEALDLDVEEVEPGYWEIVVTLGGILEKRNFHT